MKTICKKCSIPGSNSGNGIIKNSEINLIAFVLFIMFMISSQKALAHCDSFDGPVIQDAYKALEINDVNLVLKWVDEEYESEITRIFEKTYNFKGGDTEIYALVERYFLETLVRLHRAGEGEPFTGLKPAGSASNIVKMADNSLNEGDVDNLTSKLLTYINAVIKEKFEKVMELSKIKEESLTNGRAYVEAYIDYTHTLEGIHTILEHGVSAHSDDSK